MRTSSPRNALAFLGDKLQVVAARTNGFRPAPLVPYRIKNSHGKFRLQAKRDEEYLEEYRKKAHAALLKDPLSTSYSEDPEIVHKNPRIKSVIKYNAQNPGDGSSFSSSSQVNP